MALKLCYKLTFDYDSQSRRIRKQVQTKTTFGGAWGGATSHLFVYDDWNLLLWVNGSVAKQGYHWLPDMSGTWQGAGGVRGLVGISYKDQGGAAYYWSLNVGYDGNGNVVGLYGDVGGSTGLYAVYEYDPFGNTIRQNVTPAGNSLATTLGENPFRFSTKFTDDESKLLYYGYRYYSAGLGRWLNRDPIEEQGGLNLYGMVGNDAVVRWDVLCMFGSAPRVVKVKNCEAVIYIGHASHEVTFQTDKGSSSSCWKAAALVCNPAVVNNPLAKTGNALTCAPTHRDDMNTFNPDNVPLIYIPPRAARDPNPELEVFSRVALLNIIKNLKTSMDMLKYSPCCCTSFTLREVYGLTMEGHGENGDDNPWKFPLN